jgi:hypothetical protein
MGDHLVLIHNCLERTQTTELEPLPRYIVYINHPAIDRMDGGDPRMNPRSSSRLDDMMYRVKGIHDPKITRTRKRGHRSIEPATSHY